MTEVGEPPFGYIYIITFPNEKVYIGQKQSPVFVFSYEGSGTLLPSKYKKYGKENCTMEVLGWCDNLDELNAAEIEMIRIFHSRDRRYGYNLAEGGHICGGEVHEETREKLRQSNRTEKGTQSAKRKTEEEVCPRGIVNHNGFIGVHYVTRRNKYVAQIIIKDDTQFLGTVTKSKSAKTAYEAAKKYDLLLDKYYDDIPDENRNFIDGKRNPRCVKQRRFYGANFSEKRGVSKCYRSSCRICIPSARDKSLYYSKKTRRNGNYAYLPLAALMTDKMKIKEKLHLKPQTKLSFPEILDEKHLLDWEPEDVLDYLLPDWKDDKYHAQAYIDKYK